jgi:hypothetical protein
MQNQKIGYCSYSIHRTIYHGRSLDQSDSHTEMETGLLGTPLQIEIDSTSYLDAKSAPVEMEFQLKSNGRTQKVDAKFGDKEVAVTVNNSGAGRTFTLKRPSGPIVDDPMTLFVSRKQGAPQSSKCYIFDPSTVSFIQNEVKIIGTKTMTEKGRSIKVTVVDIVDPRETTRAYLDESNNLVRAESLMGIVMLPESAAVAMEAPAKYSKGVDIGFSTSITPTGRLDDPAATTELKMKLVGKDLASIPNDEAQSVTGAGGAWTLDIHPPRLQGGVSITEAGRQKPEFTKPDLNVPSDSSEFKNLARKIVGGKTNVLDAAVAIKDWVYSTMRPNAGIGVLRDASEVLKTKEGVCRDYAILTATLLRSAGIPTRLASGLVTWDGTFYYHAWDEVWDGAYWIGIDSTTTDRQISAAHVKLAQGSVAEAFSFAVLDHVTIQILSSRE